MSRNANSPLAQVVHSCSDQTCAHIPVWMSGEERKSESIHKRVTKTKSALRWIISAEHFVKQSLFTSRSTNSETTSVVSVSRLVCDTSQATKGYQFRPLLSSLQGWPKPGVWRLPCNGRAKSDRQACSLININTFALPQTARSLGASPYQISFGCTKSAVSRIFPCANTYFPHKKRSCIVESELVFFTLSDGQQRIAWHLTREDLRDIASAEHLSRSASMQPVDWCTFEWRTCLIMKQKNSTISLSSSSWKTAVLSLSDPELKWKPEPVQNGVQLPNSNFAKINVKKFAAPAAQRRAIQPCLFCTRKQLTMQVTRVSVKNKMLHLGFVALLREETLENWLINNWQM